MKTQERQAYLALCHKFNIVTGYFLTFYVPGILKVMLFRPQYNSDVYHPILQMRILNLSYRVGCPTPHSYYTNDLDSNSALLPQRSVFFVFL